MRKAVQSACIICHPHYELLWVPVANIVVRLLCHPHYELFWVHVANTVARLLCHPHYDLFCVHVANIVVRFLEVAAGIMGEILAFHEKTLPIHGRIQILIYSCTIAWALLDWLAELLAPLVAGVANHLAVQAPAPAPVLQAAGPLGPAPALVTVGTPALATVCTPAFVTVGSPALATVGTPALVTVGTQGFSPAAWGPP